jgi:hypothetical protein
MLAGDIENYSSLLDDAECKARGDELDFVYSLANAFDEHGDDAVVRKVDYLRLERIAGRL